MKYLVTIKRSFLGVSELAAQKEDQYAAVISPFALHFYNIYIYFDFILLCEWYSDFIYPTDWKV